MGGNPLMFLFLPLPLSVKSMKSMETCPKGGGYLKKKKKKEWVNGYKRNPHANISVITK